MFLEGFKRMVDTVQPRAILVYGFVTESNIEELLGYAMESSVHQRRFPKTGGKWVVMEGTKIEKSQTTSDFFSKVEHDAGIEPV